MKPYPINARLVSFCLVLTPFFSISQTIYKEGNVLTSAGDTLKGFINFAPLHLNPKKFSFKYKQEHSDIQTFTPLNATWFSVKGYESYSTFTVSASMNEINSEKLKETSDTNTVTKAIFLKDVLQGDRINLYSYRDELKNRYYILDKRQSLPTELLYRKTVKDMQESTEALFKQQLLKAAVEYGVFTADLDRLIRSANYSASDIKNIISRINSKNSTTASSIFVGTKTTLGFFAGIGINRVQITHSGKSLITVDRLNDQGQDKFKSSIVTKGYSPRFSAGLDFYLNPASRRFIFRSELAAIKLNSKVVSNYQHNTYSEAGTEYTYTFSSWNISFNPQLIYNFYNTPNFKTYLGVGGALSYHHNNDNSLQSRHVNQASTATSLQENYLAVKETSMNAVVRLGVQMNRRVDLSVVWGNPVEYTRYGGGNSASIRTSLLTISAAILFSK